MSDFHPVVLFFIIKESLAELFWPLVIAGALLVIGVLISGVRAAAHGRLARDAGFAAVVLIVIAVALVPLMPLWSGVESSALSGWLDLIFAFALALVPAVFVAGILFIGTGLRPGKR